MLLRSSNLRRRCSGSQWLSHSRRSSRKKSRTTTISKDGIFLRGSSVKINSSSHFFRSRLSQISPLCFQISRQENREKLNNKSESRESSGRKRRCTECFSILSLLSLDRHSPCPTSNHLSPHLKTEVIKVCKNRLSIMCSYPR